MLYVISVLYCAFFYLYSVYICIFVVNSLKYSTLIGMTSASRIYAFNKISFIKV